MVLRSTGEDAYFVASNGAGGFISYYPACFDHRRIQHLYAIKGGPGTGKSRFLREVAGHGASLGWRAELVYCSSDASSLDGVILTQGERCIALLDATAPHVYEPARPGFREEIVNLGVFWDSHRLEAAGRCIEALNAQKNAAYQRAYGYLSAIGALRENRDGLVLPYIQTEKLLELAEKLMRDVPWESGFSEQPALMRSVGMTGYTMLDTYYAGASSATLIEDCRGSAQYLLSAMRREAVRRSLSIRVSYDPISPGAIDGLFLCGTRRAFLVAPRAMGTAADRRISMRRFVKRVQDESLRDELELIRQSEWRLMKGVEGAFASVLGAHFELERIYGDAMNFEAKENFTKIFCRELFDLQNA